MFARFTPRARDAMVQAQEEARADRDAEIQPIHLLLGLLNLPQGIAARALAEQGVTGDTVRAARSNAAKSIAERPEPPALIPYGPATKKILELTIRQALRLGHNYIGTGHVLLALLGGEADLEGLGGRLGIDSAGVEASIRSALAAAMQ